MQIQQPKLPLSSAYLNLLQSRPVPAASRIAEAGEGDKSGGSVRSEGAAPPPMRGRLIDIRA